LAVQNSIQKLIQKSTVHALSVYVNQAASRGQTQDKKLMYLMVAVEAVDGGIGRSTQCVRLRLMNSDTVQGRRSANCRQQQRHSSQSWSATEMSTDHATDHMLPMLLLLRTSTTGRRVTIIRVDGQNQDSPHWIFAGRLSYSAPRYWAGLWISISISSII